MGTNSQQKWRIGRGAVSKVGDLRESTFTPFLFGTPPHWTPLKIREQEPIFKNVEAGLNASVRSFRTSGIIIWETYLELQ